MPEDTPKQNPASAPAGMMRVWDPEQKKVIFVTAAPGMSKITLTLRLHDAAEKDDASKSASWVNLNIERADLAMPKADFIAKYIEPALAALNQLELK